MTRYRLVSPHGIYAPGTILDTDLPAGQMFSLEWPAARRLQELGVLEPLEEPHRPQDDPGWTGGVASVQREPATGPAHPRPARVTATATARPKEQSTR